MDGKILIEAVASLLALFMVVAPATAADFQAEVIRVLEGDTIEVLHERIDCPEKGRHSDRRPSKLLPRFSSARM
jgi:hypothetical protein